MGKVLGWLATAGQLLNIGAFAYSPAVQSFWGHHVVAAALTTSILQIVAHFAPSPSSSSSTVVVK